MSTTTTTEQKGEESLTEKRARWEAFEFSLPENESGTVKVENVSYGEESNEHVHKVTVKGGRAVSCSCKAYEFGDDDRDKHMRAVDARPAVIMAADPEIEVDPSRSIPLPDADNEQDEDGSEDNEEENESETEVSGPRPDCDDCIEGVTACFEHWSEDHKVNQKDTPKIATDGGQPLTKLENGQIFEDEEGIKWEIDQRVEQVPTPTGPKPRTRLVKVDTGEVKKPKPHPRDFVEAVENGTYTLVEVSE